MPQQRAGSQRAMKSQQVGWEDVVYSGNEKPHKCLRAFNHKTPHTNILRILEVQCHSSPGGQSGSFDVPVENGR